MNHQSDFGYATGATSMRCIACGKSHLYCCDGQGGRIPFSAWRRGVTAELARSDEPLREPDTLPWREAYDRGLTVEAAICCFLDE